MLQERTLMIYMGHNKPLKRRSHDKGAVFCLIWGHWKALRSKIPRYFKGAVGVFVLNVPHTPDCPWVVNRTEGRDFHDNLTMLRKCIITPTARHQGWRNEDIHIIKIKSGIFGVPRLMMREQLGRHTGRGRAKARLKRKIFPSFGTMPRSHWSRTLPIANFCPAN